MTLVEHFLDLRSRLFRASLAVAVGFALGLIVMKEVRLFLAEPYCEVLADLDRLPPQGCTFTQLGPLDVLLLDLKIALGVGVIISAPVWLYQLWAFIAPGLHRRERRWAYGFIAIASPLFAGGAMLAFLVLERALHFLLSLSGDEIVTQLEITRYISFVVTMTLSAGLAFQFPLVILMLNITGIATARRLLGWWRVTVFIMFVLAALITPTPEPFTMGTIGLALSGLYFAAVGVAFLNDRRRARKAGLYTGLADDEISPLEEGVGPVAAPEPVGPPEPAEPPGAVPEQAPLERRFDDTT
jgi:sec-independent protein translocase protein TatC